MEVNWSNMPDDILDQIAVKMFTIENLLAFSAVCQSWHSFYMRVKSKFKPDMPWLMLADNPNVDSNSPRTFLDPSTSKYYYRSKLPKALLSWGSAYGWFVALNPDFKVFIFNPLTRAEVKLPADLGLPRRREALEDLKFILLKIPREANEEEEFLVVSIRDEYRSTSTSVDFAGPNDLSWTRILFDSNVNYVYDVVYRDGALFFLNSKGGITYVQFNADVRNQKSLTAMEYSLPVFPENNVSETKHKRLHLTESSGDLLVVIRFSGRYYTRNGGCRKKRTLGFQVYKINDGTKEWERVENLEGVSIFVGHNSSMAFQVRESTNCRRNCIYFTDDHYILSKFARRLVDVGVGIFSLDVGDPTMLERGGYEPDVRPVCHCPIWFIPSFG